MMNPTVSRWSSYNGPLFSRQYKIYIKEKSQVEPVELIELIDQRAKVHPRGLIEHNRSKLIKLVELNGSKANKCVDPSRTNETYRI